MADHGRDVVDAAPDRGSPWISGARVENLIGVLPGRDRKAPAQQLTHDCSSRQGVMRASMHLGCR